MWIYKMNNFYTYEVGYYTPDKDWVIDSYWGTKDLAAKRVNYLNGGKKCK